MAARASAEHIPTPSSHYTLQGSKLEAKDTETQEFKEEEMVNNVKYYSFLKKSNYFG